MKIYRNQTVYEAALDRIRNIFDEFPNVIVGVSGGKDSTVIYHLSLQVAREMGRLPLKVLFIDQEAEWDATVKSVRRMMQHQDVEPKWYQMPIRIFNATSAYEHWLKCWDPESPDQWLRSKEPNSVHDNIYGEDRFKPLFAAIIRKEYPKTKTCYISGVRTEESPGRFMGLTHQVAYKWITWGRYLNKEMGHYTFYPIYDWSYTDVWKAIHENKWPYNRIYDMQYCYGVRVPNMRVSNLHHETAVHSLFHLQEIEPQTYEKLVQRLAGVDMAGKFGKADYFIKKLPFMFGSWIEYRDYLLEKLIEPANRKFFTRHFRRHEEVLEGEIEEIMCRAHLNAILCNDVDGTKLDNFRVCPQVNRIRQRKRREANAKAESQAAPGK